VVSRQSRIRRSGGKKNSRSTKTIAEEMTRRRGGPADKTEHKGFQDLVMKWESDPSSHKREGTKLGERGEGPFRRLKERGKWESEKDRTRLSFSIRTFRTGGRERGEMFLEREWISKGVGISIRLKTRGEFGNRRLIHLASVRCGGGLRGGPCCSLEYISQKGGVAHGERITLKKNGGEKGEKKEQRTK